MEYNLYDLMDEFADEDIELPLTMQPTSAV